MRKIVFILPAFFLSACAAPTVQVEPSKLSKARTFPKPEYVMHKARPVTRKQTADMIRDEAKKQGVPVDFALAIAYTESRINPNVGVSSAGALGPLQVLHGTARQFDPSLTREQVKDPRINIPLGISYLKLGLIQSGNNIHTAAARYEAGLASRRTASKYSHMVVDRMRQGTVTAFLNAQERRETITDTPATAYAMFEPESTFKPAHVKLNRKVQGRVGEAEPSSAFGTPIGSLVYDPQTFTRPEGRI